VRTGPPFVPHGRLVVFYDAGCGFCRWVAAALRRWDRAHRLELLPLQAAAVDPRPLVRQAAHLPLERELHVLDLASGRISAGGDALLAVVAALPAGWLVGAFAWDRPWRAAVALAYRILAANRGRLATLLSCPPETLSGSGATGGPPAPGR
jgi:predicted DCC family thiol-disulfide oxidoreductase YuxK